MRVWHMRIKSLDSYFITPMGYGSITLLIISFRLPIVAPDGTPKASSLDTVLAALSFHAITG
jgi:hypothetical protein